MKERFNLLSILDNLDILFNDNRLVYWEDCPDLSQENLKANLIIDAIALANVARCRGEICYIVFGICDVVDEKWGEIVLQVPVGIKKRELTEDKHPEKLPNEKRVKLTALILDYFNEEDVKTLCYDLEIEYDDLPAVGRSSKVRELVTHVGNHSSTDDLLSRLRKLRPRVSWPKKKGKDFYKTIIDVLNEYVTPKLKAQYREDRYSASIQLGFLCIHPSSIIKPYEISKEIYFDNKNQTLNVGDSWQQLLLEPRPINHIDKDKIPSFRETPFISNQQWQSYLHAEINIPSISQLPSLPEEIMQIRTGNGKNVLGVFHLLKTRVGFNII